jgi:hypothetical protein
MLATLESSYRKAPFGGQCLQPLLTALSEHQGLVCETNIRLIRIICDMLKLDTRVVRSSEQPVLGAATERLVNLTLSENGTTYLSGDGADDYQLISQFELAKISVRKLGFRATPYPQRYGMDFTPGLSIVDALCYIGPEQTRRLLDQTETRS